MGVSGGGLCFGVWLGGIWGVGCFELRDIMCMVEGSSLRLWVVVVCFWSSGFCLCGCVVLCGWCGGGWGAVLEY